MIALSALVLGERVSASAWIGVAGGFSGVLLVVRPDMSGLDPAAMFILFTGMMVALQMLFNRKLGVLSDPVVVSMWGALAATGGLTLMLPFVAGAGTRAAASDPASCGDHGAQPDADDHRHVDGAGGQDRALYLF